MVCKKCGHVLQEHMKFCSKCGTVAEREPEKVSPIMPMDQARKAFAPAEEKKTESAPAAAEKTPAASMPDKTGKRSLWPVLLPIAAVLVLVIGLAIIFGSRIGLAADAVSKQNGQKFWIPGVGRAKSDDEEWNDDPSVYDEEPEVTAPAVQKKIMVMVSDAFGPLDDVNVELIDKDGEYVRTVVSRNGGIATMTMVDPGTYTLHIAKENYKDINETITMDTSTMAYDLLMEKTLERLTTTLTIRTSSLLEDCAVSAANVNLFIGNTVSEENAYLSLSSDEEGVCVFENFPYGEFTVQGVCDPYCTVTKTIQVSEENRKNEYTLYLMPNPAEKEAYVVLDWDDPNLDLDLCAFHSGTKEYVNTTRANSTNGSFLYADNTGAVGVEAIVLKDTASAAAQTVYVADITTALENSRNSSMGANGVHVTIYRHNEAPVIFTMDPASDAPVWTVCSIASGNVTEEENPYSSFVSDHIWAVDIVESKKPDPTPVMPEYDEEEEE